MRQISVFNRFKRLIPLDAKLLLYDSFILSHLNYCSMVWHVCLKSDSDKLEKLNERALRSVFQDEENDYRYLLNKADRTSLYNHSLQNIAIFNTLHTNYQLGGSNAISIQNKPGV